MSDATCKCRPQGECHGETAAANFLSELERRDDPLLYCTEIRRKLNEFNEKPDSSRIHDFYPADCEPMFVQVLREALKQGC